MAKEKDFGIFWVVLLAALFWVSVWKHEPILNWMRKVLIRTTGRTQSTGIGGHIAGPPRYPRS